MSFLAQYAFANSLTVTETWNRTGAKDGLSLYVNDSARALGVKRQFEIKSRRYKKTDKSQTPAVTTPMLEWNQKVSLYIAGHNQPVEVSLTYRFPDALGSQMSTLRPLMKDGKLAILALTDSDGELDDIGDGRTQ